MQEFKLSEAQQFCLGRGGNCSGCLQQSLITSSVCMLKWSDGVAQQLKLPVKGPKWQAEREAAVQKLRDTRQKNKEAKRGHEKSCKICGTVFTAYSTVAGYCEGCKAKGLSLKPCKYCKGPFPTRGGNGSCKPCQERIIAEGGKRAARILAGRAKAEAERRRKESA